MGANNYLQLIETLILNIGLNPSEIRIQEHDNITSIICQRNGEPEILGIGLSSVPLLTLYLPYEEKDNSSHPLCKLSSSVLEDFNIWYLRANYRRAEIPPFDEVLNELRQTKNIPVEQLHHASELKISRLSDDYVYGEVSYEFGKPPLERLCILVDVTSKNYVRDAEFQFEQAHWCIHGQYAPLIPFEYSKFAAIGIGLSATRDDEGLANLRSFSDGLPVPQDLALRVIDGNGVEVYRNPFRSDYEVVIPNPERKTHINNVLPLIQRMEAMLRA